MKSLPETDLHGPSGSFMLYQGSTDGQGHSGIVCPGPESTEERVEILYSTIIKFDLATYGTGILTFKGGSSASPMATPIRHPVIRSSREMEGCIDLPFIFPPCQAFWAKKNPPKVGGLAPFVLNDLMVPFRAGFGTFGLGCQTVTGSRSLPSLFITRKILCKRAKKNPRKRGSHSFVFNQTPCSPLGQVGTFGSRLPGSRDLILRHSSCWVII